MSIKLMAQIWENGPLRQSDRFVLLALADYANEGGECWPSIAGICRRTCLSERGAQAVLRRLEADGWLQIETGGGRKNCNLYVIKTPQQMHPAGNAPPQMDAETPQMDAENPAADAPEPLRTPIEPSKSRETPADVLCQVVRPDTARDFAAHRKAMKKPLTHEAAKRLVSKLANHPDPDAVFDLSIENGWQGVFPEKIGGPNDNRIGSPRHPDADSTARQIAFAARAGRSPSSDCF
jgi:hypothetical protein